MAIPTPEEFIELVTSKLGVTKPGDVARALGLTDYGAPQRVARWMKGRNGPNYEGTMLMLDAAGWLNITVDRAEEGGLDAAAAAAGEAESQARDLANRGAPARDTRKSA